jgi:hypothetical protein
VENIFTDFKRSISNATLKYSNTQIFCYKIRQKELSLIDIVHQITYEQN